MTRKPFPQSFWVAEGLLCVGHYPSATNAAERDVKLNGLLDCGIRRVISLTEEGERGRSGQPLEPYQSRLLELAAIRGVSVECRRLPFRDARAPTRAQMEQALEEVAGAMERRIPTYLHCQGGHGRTSTVVCCYLIRQGSTPRDAIAQVLRWRADLPKNDHPFEGDQEQFVLLWPSIA